MMLTPYFRNVLSLSILVSLYAPGTLGAPSIWRDYSTGFAIGGYDPVAYFTRSMPTPGRAGIEHRWGGANWQFENIGNRAVFARHPAIYAPQFAGYDAVALSKGLTVEGNPTLWAVYAKRTYLFADKKSLQNWKRNREEITATARTKWAVLGENLTGTSEK